MTKAELKASIVAKAKAKGLDIAEDAVERLVELAIEIVGDVVHFTENKYDDLVWAAVEGKVKEVLLSLVDKIDGQVG